MLKSITILYGSETGNSEYCAEQLEADLESSGFKAISQDMDDYAHADLHTETLLVIVTATYGDGEPPENAETLFNHLQDVTPNLSNLRFAVCGLGDSSYPNYVQTGKDFDRMLEACGAKRIVERTDCDVDFEVPFANFSKALLSYLNAQSTESVTPLVNTTPAENPAESRVECLAGPETAQRDARKTTFPSHILETHLLSGAGSNKETRHYVLDIAGADFKYRAGDCLGVYPQNCPDEVEALLDALALDGEAVVSWRGTPKSLGAVLLHDASIRHITIALIQHLAEVEGPTRAAAAGGDTALQRYIATHHILDVVRGTPGISITAQALVNALRPLQPRLYSIASSPVVYPDQVHLTVETQRFHWNDRAVAGVASGWLADRAGDGEVAVYLHANSHFRLPDPDTPILMIGPGTGVAPFRGFLQERAAKSAVSKNWLFFGHQHAATDFLYGEELKAWSEAGVLNVTAAWSRDGEETIYVQDKLEEHAEEVWRWLQEGAVVYVCGDASGMAPAVHRTLAAIASDHGEADGEAFLSRLQTEGRYQRDVY